MPVVSRRDVILKGPDIVSVDHNLARSLLSDCTVLIVTGRNIIPPEGKVFGKSAVAGQVDSVQGFAYFVSSLSALCDKGFFITKITKCGHKDHKV